MQCSKGVTAAPHPERTIPAMAPPYNPCTECGACCASFSVDFARAELLSQGGAVPDGLVVDVTASTCRMRGTDHAPPRCAAKGVRQSASMQAVQW